MEHKSTGSFAELACPGSVRVDRGNHLVHLQHRHAETRHPHKTPRHERASHDLVRQDSEPLSRRYKPTVECRRVRASSKRTPLSRQNSEGKKLGVRPPANSPPRATSPPTIHTHALLSPPPSPSLRNIWHTHLVGLGFKAERFHPGHELPRVDRPVPAKTPIMTAHC